MTKMRTPHGFAPPRMPAKRLAINGEDRASYGGLFTIRNVDTGEVLTFRTRGRQFVARAAELIDARPGTWRVLCMSTPETIYRDLQGTRATEWHDGVHYSERDAFGLIGRLDLLDKRFDTLIPGGRQGRTHA